MKWHRIQDIFDEAMDRPPQERPAFLDNACGDDGELRAEVESLLEHDDAASPNFLQPPQPPQQTPPMDPPSTPDSLIGQSVGGYLIKSVIATGGMGTVYQAVQVEPQRVVALKIMHPNVAPRSALRRFQFESQTLARLRHPNIAQIFAAGTHTPSPSKGKGGSEGPTPSPSQGEGWGEGSIAPVAYFAMEYIPNAKTIIQYAREKALSTRGRLRLFTKVCDAVHHGHQRGIIHRDLKPANVLVADEQSRPDGRRDNGADSVSPSRDREGAGSKAESGAGRNPLAHARGSDLAPQACVKVIDFGIARAIDSDIAITTQTDVGQLLGTMQYMSPEQCDADPHDLDTRSDVYALGVLLYELLTGSLPYETTGTTIYRATQIIKEQAPPRPSTINPKLRGDLETIALTALAKDRDRRYQSAAELAADIERYLRGEPIAAHPPGRWRRGMLWAARHPIVATSAASLSVAILTIAATIVSVWIIRSRPHDLVRYRGGRLVESRDADQTANEIWLISIAGNRLHKWDTPAPRGITFAEMVDRPAEFGGGKLVILGYSAAPNNPDPGCLCAFDLDTDSETPIWKRHIEKDDIPPDLLKKGRGAATSSVDDRGGMVADFFPDLPGYEILAIHIHGGYSQFAIRVYDLNGKLLYQVWRDGGIKDVYRMSEPGLLVCLGGDEWAKEHHPSYAHLKVPYAQVIFAIRPRRGFITTHYLSSTPSDDELSPVWCKYVLPPEVHDLSSGAALTPPDHSYDPAHFVQLNLNFDAPAGAGMSWVIDEHGNEVICPTKPVNQQRCTRVVSDNYNRDQRSPQPTLPDPDDFHLGPLPPIKPPSVTGPALRRDCTPP